MVAAAVALPTVIQPVLDGPNTSNLGSSLSSATEAVPGKLSGYYSTRKRPILTNESVFLIIWFDHRPSFTCRLRCYYIDVLDPCSGFKWYYGSYPAGFGNSSQALHSWRASGTSSLMSPACWRVDPAWFPSVYIFCFLVRRWYVWPISSALTLSSSLMVTRSSPTMTLTSLPMVSPSIYCPSIRYAAPFPISIRFWLISEFIKRPSCFIDLICTRYHV